MQGRHADNAPPVIGVANTYAAPGVYTLQVPCPRTRYAPQWPRCICSELCPHVVGHVRACKQLHGVEMDICPLLLSGMQACLACLWCNMGLPYGNPGPCGASIALCGHSKLWCEGSNLIR